ncbi:hypothetical protein [Streptomyces sp. 142MFCol3.1]|uniref:hypothetical protein n=1 Tax=Streptomyces sp. 142MFCol3.1 TaxID=1172179 RepID=UPI00041AE939|nr:hypothetical protein [Streptomyces sp. 142MFCol3.1]
MRKHRGHLAAAAVLAALATMAAQCDDSQDGSTQGGGQSGGRPAASARSTPPSHDEKPPSKKPSPNQRGTTPPPDPYTGLVSVNDMRAPLAADGSSQVSCSALDSQFTVTPYNARARWRARWPWTTTAEQPAAVQQRQRRTGRGPPAVLGHAGAGLVGDGAHLRFSLAGLG